jgi:uroporphyrinogen decarboxylase
MPSPTLTHRQRLEACLSDKALDRTPIALWRHFPVDDQTPEGLAASTAHFQRTYDFDLIKVTPASSFCLLDWGVTDRWNGADEGTRDYQTHPIKSPEDWYQLKPLMPDRGSLGRQLACLKLLVKEFGQDTPILQTIFSPLAQAKNLAGKENLQVHLRQAPEAVAAGLEIITQTSLAYLEAVQKTGVDGIFYAVQHAQYNLLSLAEFKTFGEAYDRRVLNAAQNMWLKLVHLHGENVMFDQVASYPVNIINWHDRHTPPSLGEAINKFSGALCGGLRRYETMVLGSAADVEAEVKQAIQATNGKRLIVGTGCVLPITAPHGNILAARRSVEQRMLP